MLPTVQNALQQALLALAPKDFSESLPAVQLASRTDAGVHAVGQVALAKLPADFWANVHHPLRALNTVLPSSVAIRQLDFEVPPDFSIQHQAKWRWYRYQWSFCQHPSPQLGPFTHRLYGKATQRLPNLALMQEAAALTLGTHPFTYFKSPRSPMQNDICTLHGCHLWWRSGSTDFLSDKTLSNKALGAVLSPLGPPTLVLDVVGDRFLYKMVRHLAGFLLAVGMGKLSPQAMVEALEGNYHASFKRPVTAKPDGLSLMAIDYASNLTGAYPLFENDPYVACLHRFLQGPATHLNSPEKA